MLQSGPIVSVLKNKSRKCSLESSGNFEKVRNMEEIRKLRRDVSLSGPQILNGCCNGTQIQMLK